MPTIWQYGALRVNDDTAIGFNNEEAIQKLIVAGYKRVELLLNARPSHLGEVPRWKVDKVKQFGARAWGVVWADSFASPDDCYAFIRSERIRLGVTGFVVNAEDGIEARDQSGQAWSWKFLQRYRSDPVTSKLSLGLDTYNGCGGLALKAWQDKGARLICQTHHEGETHAWPIDGYMTWAKQYGWTHMAKIKPEWGVYNPKPNRAEQVASAVRANTDGFIAYYSEGSGDPAETLIPLLNEAKAAGVCY